MQLHFLSPLRHGTFAPSHHLRDMVSRTGHCPGECIAMRDLLLLLPPCNSHVRNGSHTVLDLGAPYHCKHDVGGHLWCSFGSKLHRQRQEYSSDAGEGFYLKQEHSGSL